MKIGNSGGYELGQIGRIDDEKAAELERTAPFVIDDAMRSRIMQMIEEGAHNIAAERGMASAGEMSRKLKRLENPAQRYLKYLEEIAAERTELTSTLSTELNGELQPANDEEASIDGPALEPLEHLVLRNRELFQAVRNIHADLQRRMKRKPTFAQISSRDPRGGAGDEAKNNLLLSFMKLFEEYGEEPTAFVQGNVASEQKRKRGGRFVNFMIGINILLPAEVRFADAEDIGSRIDKLRYPRLSPAV